MEAQLRATRAPSASSQGEGDERKEEAKNWLAPVTRLSLLSSGHITHNTAYTKPTENAILSVAESLSIK